MDRLGRPVLELLVGPTVPAGVELVLIRAARVVAPRARHARAAGGDDGAEVVARLGTSLDAPGLDDAIADPSVPLAVVCDRPGVPDAVVRRADVLLAPWSVPLPAGAPSRTVLRLPAVDPWRHRAVPPFVRAGWRRRLSWPDDLVVAVGYEPEVEVDDATLPTVLALASAAAVRGPHTLLAMALGTPVVTDAPTAAAVRSTHGRELLVAAPDDDPVAMAHDLAAAPADCARLGRQARALVEREHDPEAVAGDLVAGLGIALPAPPGPASGAILYAACRELGLPPDGSLYAHRTLIAARMERTAP
jgi:glycosyl transferase family 1